jgi:hypothetical protein
MTNLTPESRPAPLPPAADVPLTHPDDLTFGEVFAIKAATGIDPAMTLDASEQLLALLWFALRPTEHARSWPEMLELHGTDVTDWFAQLRELDAQRQAEQEAAADAAAEVEDAEAIAATERAVSGEPDPGPQKPGADPTLPPATG